MRIESIVLILILLEECFEHSKVFVLISPHNPTGTIWNKEVLIEIIKLS